MAKQWSKLNDRLDAERERLAAEGVTGRERQLAICAALVGGVHEQVESVESRELRAIFEAEPTLEQCLIETPTREEGR